MSDLATAKPALAPHERLILALDVPTVAEAEALVRATEGAVGVYKVGLELVLSGGLGFAADIARSGHKVFLDMKLLDIPNTVAGAVRAVSGIGARFLTVHAYPQAVRAAVAVSPPDLAITAVTVLTSMDEADLTAAGYQTTPEALVAARLNAIAAAGANAVVCAPTEAAAASQLGLTVITPGVRLASDAAGDQKRIATPQSAITAGADYLVVGRPIAQAANPRAAAAAYAEAAAESPAA